MRPKKVLIFAKVNEISVTFVQIFRKKHSIYSKNNEITIVELKTDYYV